MLIKKIPQPLILLLSLLVIAASCGQKEESGRKLTGNPKIDKLKLPDGFEAELLYSPGENDQGSLE